MQGQHSKSDSRLTKYGSVAAILPGLLIAACLIMISGGSTDAQIVIKPLKITTTSLPDGARGEPYVTFVNASGGTSPYVFTILSGSLHTGLSLSAGGAISGTPQSEGTRSFTVQVKDKTQLTATKTLSLNVIHYPRLQSLFPAPNSHQAQVNTNVVATFTKEVQLPSTRDFTLHGSASGRLSGSYSGHGSRQLQFMPSQPLSAGEEVEVTLTTNLYNSFDGLAMRKPYVARFRAATSGSGQGDTWNEGQRFSGALGIEPTLWSDAMHLVDLDGDGDLDLVTAGNDGGTSKIWIFFNTGTGAFVDGTVLEQNDGEVTGGWSEVLTGDVDNDGDIDLVALMGGTGDPSTVFHSIFLNDGLGLFFLGSTIAVRSQWDEYYRRGDLGDIDGDGDLDLVVGMVEYQRRLLVYTNNGPGQFTDPPRRLDLDHIARPVGLADFDNDGDLDYLSTLTNGDASYRIYANDGSGNFTIEREFGGSVGAATAIADVDNDGDLDVISAGWAPPWTTEQGNTVYYNDGNMSFLVSRAFGYIEAQSPSVVKTGDVNADGSLDIVVGGSGQNRIYLNGGFGNFPSEGIRAFGTGFEFDGVRDQHVLTQTLALGDIDGDGDLDIAAHHGSQVFAPGTLEARNRIYINQ
ncbi:MAG: VCBS repeat-containing protein [Planctomycetaceae bacterium]|nr:VCBS repeat-containing protein [Planctomycetaceae bacterium]